MKEFNPEFYELQYKDKPFIVAINDYKFYFSINCLGRLFNSISSLTEKCNCVLTEDDVFVEMYDFFQAANNDEWFQEYQGKEVDDLRKWEIHFLQKEINKIKEERLIKFRKEERKIERISSDCRINTYHYQDKPIRWVMHDFRPLISVEDECNALGISIDSEKVEARKDKGECYLFSNDEVKDLLVIGKGGAHSLGMIEHSIGMPFNKWLNQSFPRQEDALQRRIAILERENKELRLKAGGTL